MLELRASVKEFLSGLGIDYESVNVSARPEAMEELRALGVRTVPVVARGRDYVFAQELADVSRFVGKDVEFERLSAPVWSRSGFRFSLLRSGTRCRSRPHVSASAPRRAATAASAISRITSTRCPMRSFRPSRHGVQDLTTRV